MDALPVAIHELLIRFFGSSVLPDYSMASEIYRRRPFDPLLDRLRKAYVVEEQTDINEDLSFVWTIRKDEDQCAVLYLSFVGPFAVLVDEIHGSLQVVSAGNTDPDYWADAVIEIVKDEGFIFLPKSTLKMEIRIWEDEDLRQLQHVLFVVGEDLPL